jgi:antitoxin CptB
MTNKEILIKKIIYRSTHRGTKEMDMLLGNFVKVYINDLNELDLKHLEDLILLEDEIIYKSYLGNTKDNLLPTNKITDLLKKFKM